MTFEADDLIRQAIARHKGHIAVLWSGGRDSTLVLHLALKEDPKICVIFENTLCESGETWKYIRKLAREWDLNLHTTMPEKTFWQCVKEFGLPTVRGTDGVGHSPRCCQYLKERPGNALKKKLGITAYFTGLMKEESHQRFLSLSRYDNSGKSQDEIAFCAQRYYKKTTGEWAYHPIANWSSEEIDQYYVDHNLPINEFYIKWGGLYKRSGCLLCTAYSSWERKLSISHPYAYRRLKRIQIEERQSGFTKPGKLGSFLQDEEIPAC